MKKIFSLWAMFCGLAVLPLAAQEAVPPPAPVYQPLSDQQLDQLLGPIALYPDPLIAQILPAATLPAQIVLADRYVSGGGDPNQIDAQPWDVSVQAVARYPTVLKYMDDNLGWTTDLGQAFLNQQEAVMDSIQRLRASAQNFGNLQSTPQQQVVYDSGDIEILPADPQVIYVPVYSPDVIYYRSGFGISFGIGFPIGGWLNCDFNWHQRNLIIWSRAHPRPRDWWHERPAQRTVIINHQPVWRPEFHRNGNAIHRGDRGWGNHPAPIVRRPDARPTPPPHNAVNTPRPAATPKPASRPAPPAQIAQPNRPTPNSAFIGIQSSRQTRNFSDRGQQSRQTMNPPAARPSPPVSHPNPPASRPAPASRPSFPANGGNHGAAPHSPPPRH